MRENFQEVREQVEILDLAQYLMKQGKRPTLFYYPDERTASIKIYPNTQSFFDFGRAVGGDCIKLYSHIRRCDQWTALLEIRELYNLEKKPDRRGVKEKIKQQEAEHKAIELQKREKQKQWQRSKDN